MPVLTQIVMSISQVIRTDSVLPLALEDGSADPKSDLLILEPSRQELFESLSSKYWNSFPISAQSEKKNRRSSISSFVRNEKVMGLEISV